MMFMTIQLYPRGSCTIILRADLWGAGPLGLTRLVVSVTIAEGDIVIG